DITDEDHVLEAGMGFAVKLEKARGQFGDFIGREAVLRAKERGLKSRLLQFKLTDPEPLVYHNEPIWAGKRIVGQVRSGAYGHTLGGSIAMGYVSCEPSETAADVAAQLRDRDRRRSLPGHRLSQADVRSQGGEDQALIIMESKWI